MMATLYFEYSSEHIRIYMPDHVGQEFIATVLYYDEDIFPRSGYTPVCYCHVDTEGYIRLNVKCSNEGIGAQSVRVILTSSGERGVVGPIKVR